MCRIDRIYRLILEELVCVNGTVLRLSPQNPRLIVVYLIMYINCSVIKKNPCMLSTPITIYWVGIYFAFHLQAGKYWSEKKIILSGIQVTHSLTTHLLSRSVIPTAPLGQSTADPPPPQTRLLLGQELGRKGGGGRVPSDAGFAWGGAVLLGSVWYRLTTRGFFPAGFGVVLWSRLASIVLVWLFWSLWAVKGVRRVYSFIGLKKYDTRYY